MSNVSPLRQTDESPFHTGDRIRKVRELVGYGTRKGDFAELVDIDRGSLAKYESTGQVKSLVVEAISTRTGARFEFLAYGIGPVFGEDGPNIQPRPKENPQITVRSLAPVTRLRPNTATHTHTTLAPVTKIRA